MVKAMKDRKWVCAFTVLALLGLCWIAGQTNVAFANKDHTEGPDMQMPVFYDGVQFTVNMFEVPGEEAILEHNKSVNEIYATNDLDEEQEFLPVIDAIQGDGFNPLWHQILIVYNVEPFQLTSDTEVDEAVDLGLITLNETDEVYRCSVVGPGPKKVEEE
jgi:hypothetical protein